MVQGVLLQKVEGLEENMAPSTESHKKRADTAEEVVRERLAEAAASLERIDHERESGDPMFGKVLEERIVWRELRDLELQEFDEQTSVDHARMFLERFDAGPVLKWEDRR